MEILGFVAVPAISVICFLGGKIFKTFTKEPQHKHIPVVVATSGAVLGAVAFVTLPGYLMVENIIEALALGIISGLGATGVHQIIKQNAQ